MHQGSEEGCGVDGRIIAGLLQSRAPHERGSLKLVTNPLDLAGGILRRGICFDDDIEIAGGDTGAVNRAGGWDGVVGAPGKGRACEFCWIGPGIGGRGIAGIVDIAHDLVQREPRFLKGIKHLGFGLVALL